MIKILTPDKLGMDPLVLARVAKIKKQVDRNSKSYKIGARCVQEALDKRPKIYGLFY